MSWDAGRSKSVRASSDCSSKLQPPQSPHELTAAPLPCHTELATPSLHNAPKERYSTAGQIWDGCCNLAETLVLQVTIYTAHLGEGRAAPNS